MNSESFLFVFPPTFFHSEKKSTESRRMFLLLNIFRKSRKIFSFLLLDKTTFIPIQFFTEKKIIFLKIFILMPHSPSWAKNNLRGEFFCVFFFLIKKKILFVFISLKQIRET